MPHKGEMITLKSASDGATIAAYHVKPSGERKGGLVLAQEIFGVTDHIRDLCDGFARDGYQVLAPSLYDREEPGFEATYSDEDIARSLRLRDAAGFTHTQGDIQAAIDWLRINGNRRVHITGYCYGGSVAWIAACRCKGLTSAAGYYGRHVIDHVEEEPQCETILHFGERDQTIPMEWVREIEAAHPQVRVYVYDADHGFNSDRRANYDEDATLEARDRTLELFESAGF
ncbi:dienelactone hydrolase family protein [Pyruvatibacter sp.]|uniref:dienelactone hydrolase family protein n=1 Tax=Pyruvatibacter sp. TaxID=1981328 RepID=UPI0032ED53BE